MLRWLCLSTAFLWLPLCGWAGSSLAAAENNATVKFELDVMPILTVAGCNQGACHGKARGQNGFALSLLGFDAEFDYSAIVKEGRGRRVFPASPETSLLLRKATGQIPHGGGARLKLDEPHYQTLRRWVAQGMPRAGANDPRLVRVKLTPSERPLKTGETQQLKVTAYYSDGSEHDVTALSAFQSNDVPIAAVDGGKITAGKLSGETVVMARYMGHIATWNVVIPFTGTIAAEKYAALPKQNFIDPLVWNKLREVGVLPSEVASDVTLLRRVYLDVIGRLPTPDESRAYLADKHHDKFSRLVDTLLDRPEYADYWANKWCDLLRPNSFHVGQKATLNFDAWIRDAFRRNLPYDQFVRELLTAQGSTWTNGATVMFRDRRRPDDLTTMVSQLFLGVRLECAKCHHHPFEVYGQDEFFGFAAYFNRLGFKGTGISAPISGGEEMIFVARKAKPVMHPITDTPVEPKPLFGEATPLSDDADPREALFAWLSAPSNPYFAQVAVNRVWADLMGRGIVDPVDDLRVTNPPSNAALLKALADDFRSHKFDFKHLIRTITASRVYRLSSLPNETNVGDTRNYSRHYRVRLRGEVLLDAVSDITGVNETFQGMPPQSRAMQLWNTRLGSLFLDSFGRPNPNQDPPCERTSETTMVQALHLMNAPGLHAKVTSSSGQIAKLAASKLTPEALIEELYLLAYCRVPTDDERQQILPLFKSDRARSTEDLMWALLNTPEFMFKD